MKKLLPVGLVFFVLACSSSSQSVKVVESYVNLYNDHITGIQEDKLKQASDSYYRGNYTRSLEIYQDLLPGFLNSDNQEAVLNLLVLISASQAKLGRYEKAREVLQMVAKRIQLMMDPSEKKREYATLYLVEMGTLLLESSLSPSRDFTEGFLRHGLWEANATGNDYLLMRASENLGNFLIQEKNRLAEAQIHLQRAFLLASKQRRTHVFVRISRLLANLHLKQKVYSQALERLVFAYRLYQKEGYYFQQALILMDMGEIFYQTGDFLLSLRYYKRAYEIIYTSETVEMVVKNRYLELLDKIIRQLKSQLPDLREENIFKLSILD